MFKLFRRVSVESIWLKKLEDVGLKAAKQFRIFPHDMRLEKQVSHLLLGETILIDIERHSGILLSAAQSSFIICLLKQGACV